MCLTSADIRINTSTNKFKSCHYRVTAGLPFPLPNLSSGTPVRHRSDIRSDRRLRQVNLTDNQPVSVINFIIHSFF